MALALVGVASVIWLASNVLTNRYVSLREIADARRHHDMEIARREMRRGVRRRIAELLSGSGARDRSEYQGADQRLLGVDTGAGGTRDGPPLPAFVYASGLFKQMPRDASFLFRDTEVDDVGALYSLQVETHRMLDALLTTKRVISQVDRREWTTEDVPELRERAHRLDRAAERIVEYANDFTTRRAFRDLRTRILIAGGVTAVGVSFFAWFANPVTKPVAKVEAPLRVEVVLTAQGTDLLKGMLGVECIDMKKPLPAIAIAGDLQEPTVVVTPAAPGCQARQVTLKKKYGVAVPQLAPPTP